MTARGTTMQPNNSQTYAMIGQQHRDGLLAHLQELQREHTEIAAYLRDLEHRIAQQEGACNFANTMIQQAAEAASSAPAATTQPAEETEPEEAAQ